MSVKHLHGFLAKCMDLKILVIGDIMIDQYLWGEIDRISPEAPVPVVDIKKREQRLGGAANAALNMQAMGAEVVLCGVAGTDMQSHTLLDLLENHGFDKDLIFQFPTRRTTVKTRVICKGQHVLRVDEEDLHHLESSEMSQLMSRLFERLNEFDAIVFSDYDKGMLHETLIQMISVQAESQGIPIMVDPKFQNFLHYSDCTLFKPNIKELNEGLGLRLDNKSLADITDAVMQLRGEMPHRFSLVTLSDNGMLLVDPAGRATHIKAHRRDIIDVSGAGDTVMAVVALGIAAGISPEAATEYANMAAGLVCEEVGVATVNVSNLEKEVARLGERLNGRKAEIQK